MIRLEHGIKNWYVTLSFNVPCNKSRQASLQKFALLVSLQSDTYSDEEWQWVPAGLVVNFNIQVILCFQHGSCLMMFKIMLAFETLLNAPKLQ